MAFNGLVDRCLQPERPWRIPDYNQFGKPLRACEDPRLVEWIDHLYPRFLKIASVAGDDSQSAF